MDGAFAFGEETALDLVGKEFKVLDDGFVKLVSFTGSDKTAVDAARLTSQSEGKDDEGLLRYLMRHRHDTPFEFAGFTIHIRIPMDAWRQFVRHRLFSINEYSTRYSEAIDSQQKTAPDAWRLQAQSNRQGSDGFLNAQPTTEDDYIFGTFGDAFSKGETSFQQFARDVYQQRLAAGIAREQARKDLPLSTYTEAWVECDLRGWLHFLGLRMDSHAQKEIRDYADTIGNEIVAKLFPKTWRAFCDYRLGAVNLTRLDALMASWIAGSAPHNRDETFRQSCKNLPDLIANGWDRERCRERDECRDKLRRIGLLPEA